LTSNGLSKFFSRLDNPNVSRPPLLNS